MGKGEKESKREMKGRKRGNIERGRERKDR